MYSNKKKFFAILLTGSVLLGTLLPSMEVRAEYINTTRDTALPEEAIEIVEQSVDDYEKLYETDSAIYVNTELLGPDPSEKSNPTPSYPYIVLKTEYLDQTVIFE